MAGHADAGICQRDGACFFIRGDGHAQIAFRVGNGGAGELFETQLFQGIRRVGNKLAHEYLAVAVEGMNHDVEKLPYFCLKLVCIVAHSMAAFYARGCARSSGLCDIPAGLRLQKVSRDRKMKLFSR